MKYKIPEGTETYKKLEALWKRMMAADAEAYNLVQAIRKEMGLPWKGTEHNYAANNNALAGGLVAIQFDAKPEGWKRVGKPHQRLFAPMAKRKDLCDRFRALPTVPLQDLNGIVGFERFVGLSANGEGMVAYRAPGLQWVDGAFLMTVPVKAKYTPPNADFVEILESEYQRLAEAGRKEEAVA